MMFWLATVSLVLLGSAFVALPLIGHRHQDDRGDNSRTDANVVLYQEQVAQLRKEHEAGTIDDADFESLVTELQRSLLRDVGPLEGQEYFLNIPNHKMTARSTRAILGKQVGFGLTGVSRLVPLSALLLIPFLAYGLYDRWGHYDDIKLSGLFRQAIHPSEDSEATASLITNLKDGVDQYPDNQWAWYFLGRSYSRLGMHGEAMSAYQEAIPYLASEPDKVMAMSQFVLASFLGAGRTLTVEATAMAEQTLALNPDQQTVLRILATAAREKEDFRTAVVYWQRLVQANPSSSSARVYRSNIAAAQRILLDKESMAIDKAEDHSSPQIKVQVAVADHLNLPPGQRVFVAARNPVRPGTPPLAVAQLTVAELPTTVVLDNSSAVGPFNLSAADTVVVSALVSQGGNANPRPGDVRVETKPINRSDDITEIDLLLADKVL